jgi:hypothetical protein
MLRYLALIDMPENGGNPTKLLLRDRPLIAAVVGWAIYNTSIIYFTGIRNSVATIFGS